MTKDAKAPAWGYRKDEAKIFEDGIIPKGWYDSPAKIKEAKDKEPAAEGAETVEGGAGE